MTLQDFKRHSEEMSLFHSIRIGHIKGMTRLHKRSVIQKLSEKEKIL